MVKMFHVKHSPTTYDGHSLQVFDGPLIKVRVVTIDYGCLHRSAAEKFRRLHDRLS